ncbi:putative polyketide synthase [Leptodontidium sp. 2 PMI_412]|nr:putative polyketide synthase [Leptodontidium sp. 2 PMI_412]
MAILQLPANRKIAAVVGSGSHISGSLIQSSGLHVLHLISNFEKVASDQRSKSIPADGSTTYTPEKSTNPIHGSPIDDNTQQSKYPPHSIAIVGMAGRFPGADDLNELWALLLSGGVTVEPAPAHLGLPEPKTGDNSGSKWWGNFLRNPDTFDHRFFKKSSREALHWDPQMRILLEVTYEALESAGYFGASSIPQPDDYGCYVGVVMNNYEDNVSCHPQSAYATIGTNRSFFSGTVSHHFGWTGPALSIDTACSSSLVAINSACRAIWSGECSRAVAGGTNVFTNPFDYRNLQAAGFLSLTGQCKPFDAAGDGYCRGEGVGVVVLKPLTAAIEENDNILGVIVGSAANQNQNFSHITVPHSGSQVRLYEKVLDLAGVKPEAVSYVEAHGTGTGVGDPIEYQSIRQAFGGPSRDSTLIFGSIKGNIGHTEATAGVVGLIKVLLMMQHGKIPAQANHTQMNPNICVSESDKMAIPRTNQSWDACTRVACVNSYGAAGSNAAVIVRQIASSFPMCPGRITHSNSRLSTYPLFISAASANSLLMFCKKLLTWLSDIEAERDTEILVSDLGFNLADRANHSLPYTFSATVKDNRDFKDKLMAAVAGTSFITLPDPKPVVLVFGGQESDFIGLSEDIYLSSVIFRYHLDTVNEVLISLGYEGLYPTIFQQTPVSSIVTLHAALFAVQYSSAKAWIECGLSVNAVVGHSFGQLTAYCISGVLSLKDAIKLVTGRALIMLKYWGTERGSMLFLKTSVDKVSEVINLLAAEGEPEPVEIACYNGAQSHVVVGSKCAVDAVENLILNMPALQTTIRTKRLKVTHGFHSQLTESLLPHLEALAKTLTWNQPTIHLESCDKVQNDSKPDYHAVAEHMRRPVYFQRAIERLTKRLSHSVWIEAGRGSSVIQLVQGSIADTQRHLFISPQFTSVNAQSSLTGATVELWRAGYPVQYWPFHRRQRTSYQQFNLPPYQFEKTQLWLAFTGRGTESSQSAPADMATIHEFLSFMNFKDVNKKEAVFQVSPRSERFKSLLAGHVLAGQSLAPASLYFEVVARAALLLQSDTEAINYVPVVENMVMKSPITLNADVQILLNLEVLQDSSPSWQFSITSQSIPVAAGKVTEPSERSSGIVRLKKRDDAQANRNFERFETLTGFRRYEYITNHLEAEKMQGKHIYRAFNQIVCYGEKFQGIKSIACVGTEAAGRVTVSVDGDDPAGQRLCDTPMTDSFMQFAGFLVNYFHNPDIDDVFVCTKIEMIEIGGGFSPDAKNWIVYSNMAAGGDGDPSADAYIFDAETKKMVMAVFGCRFSKMARSLLAKVLKGANTSGSTDKTKIDATKMGEESPIMISNPEAMVLKRPPSKRAALFQVLSNVTDIPVEELKDEATLEDLGIDSLMATEVLNDVRTALGVTIDLTTFLFFSNLQAMTAYVDSNTAGAEQESDSDSCQVNTPTSEIETSNSGSVLVETGTPPKIAIPAPQGLTKAPQSLPRPKIVSAYDAFNGIRLHYDLLAVGAKAIGFCNDVYPDQARLVLAYVVEAFAKLGCNLNNFHAGDAVPAVDSLPRHQQLVRQLYSVLEDGNLITLNKAGFLRTDVNVDAKTAEATFQEILPVYVQHANVHRLIKVIGSELAACLTGEKDGLQMVFGNKTNKQCLEDMYENWPLLRTPTLLLGDFLINALTNFSGSGKFRLLEIGGGTGGTTRYIISHLQNHGIPFEYTFTDLSPSLVATAKKHFKGVDGMSFEVLDIEQAPKQKFEAVFHIIIATNCIHATRRLDRSLLNLRKMLREDGALTLVEVTKNMFWLDIVWGLFEGWWLFEDGRSHALVDEKHWERLMKEAGFKEVLWTDGDSPESKMVRVIGGFLQARPPMEKDNKKEVIHAALETVVYKRIGNIEIHADVYYPNESNVPAKKMPIALMIHGGSHIIFSRKDIRPAQTRLLLEKGFLPVSLDHRLCPEVTLREGPMVDICDALEWARFTLPGLKLQRSGLQIDGERVVVVGWSSGGQLAMSLGWTAPQRGLKPPEAILAFYSPTNYEDEWWTYPNQPNGVEDRGDEYDILEGIKDEPITNYGIVGAWEPLSDPRLRTDPRCRIVLHINWKAQTLPIIVGGLPSKKQAEFSKVLNWKDLPQPSLEKIVAVSPLAQIKSHNYRTPTFFIHGTNDDLIPWKQSQGTYLTLRDQGISTGFSLIEGAPHICDLSSDPDSDGWKATLRGYDFLSSHVFD